MIAFVLKGNRMWCNDQNHDKGADPTLSYSYSSTYSYTFTLSVCFCFMYVFALIKYACSLNFFNLKPLAVKFCGLVRRLIKVAWQQSWPQLYFTFTFTLTRSHTFTRTLETQAGMTCHKFLGQKMKTYSLHSFANDNFILIKYAN